MTEEDGFRSIVGGIVLLSTAVYLWHRIRAPLATEQEPESAAFRVGRPLAAIFLFSPVIIYVVYPTAIEFAHVPTPAIVREFCGVAAAGGLFLLYASLHSLGTNIASTTSVTSNQTLVTDGAYQWMRHPLYGAAFYLLVGCAFLASNWLLFGAAIILFVLLRRLLIPAEERQLVAKFGREYEEYRRRHLPLFPRWW